MPSRPDGTILRAIAMPRPVRALVLACLFRTSSALGFPIPFANNNKAATTTANNVVDGDRLRKIPVVICPGFGNDAIDYVNPLEQGEENGFVSALSRRGFDPDLISVLPLDRIEWVRVAGGLFDVPDFYTGNCRPEGLGYGWYVRRLRKTIQEAYDRAGREERVMLIGHSAGGWLARAALGDGSWDADDDVSTNDEEGAVRASDRVRALVTIGAIHRPPAGDAASTCVTRGALSYLDDNYPGAFLSEEGVAYVSVGGDAVMGRQRPDGDNEKVGSEKVNDIYKVRGEGSASSVAYTAYDAVSGDGERTGDGVVPLDWALLDGSRSIVLDGVLHSINEAGTTVPTDRWYGADAVVDRWLPVALEEAGIGANSKGNGSEFSMKAMLESIIPGQK